MPVWSTIYQDSYEDGFYDQNGAGELTIPLGHTVQWSEADGMPRPECDDKNASAGQSEVYDGQHAASVFTVYAKHDAWLVAGPIAVVPGLLTRGSAYGMIVCHGIDGDDTKPGAQAVRAGIAETDDVLQAEWGMWWAVRDNLSNERVWAKLETPGITPVGGNVYLFLQTKSDYPVAISAAHFDLETVEQLLDDVTPPPPPPAGDGLQFYVDDVQAALDRLQGYVNANAVRCVVV